MSKPRSIWGMIATNFLRSFKPRQIQGNYMGEDYFGNKYYEIPPNPAIGKRRPSRWFEPVNKDDFEQEKTAEWESWLRGRRDEPPTREELIQNLTIIEMKKVNAAKIDKKFAKAIDATATKAPESDKLVTGMAFPSYKEYERVPGKNDGEK